jgi:mono/diheme cytochrome c family protein
MQGPVTVKGTRYDGLMPAYGTGVEMSDDEVAAVLTYVRQSWGNAASAVTPQDVARERAAARAATGPVTAEELRPLM